MLRALLTNIQAMASQTAVKKKSGNKEAYFDKTWGDQVAFNRTVDKASYSNEAPDQTAQIHEQILVMYKTSPTKSGRNRSSFLEKMAGESLDFIQEQKTRLLKTRQDEELCHNSMAALTEHMFEILKSYAYELNNALGYGPLHVAATNPQTVTEVVKYNSLRQAEETITYYRARLSTPSYSLVLRGDKKGIQAFIMPVERTLGLSKQECHFLPVLRLATKLIGDSVAWETDENKSLTPSMVEVICMNLFQRLIEETKTQVLKEEQEKDDFESRHKAV